MSWCDSWEAIEDVALSEEPVARALAAASPAVRTAIDGVLNGGELSVEDGERLFAVRGGPDLLAMVRAADVVRATDVGDDVTYVVNRNVNFTNVCFVNCQFCAFKRQRWESDAYTHGTELILGKVAEAIERGATEICEGRPVVSTLLPQDRDRSGTGVCRPRNRQFECPQAATPAGRHSL
jgi:hypothetical protein